MDDQSVATIIIDTIDAGFQRCTVQGECLRGVVVADGAGSRREHAVGFQLETDVAGIEVVYTGSANNHAIDGSGFPNLAPVRLRAVAVESVTAASAFKISGPSTVGFVEIMVILQVECVQITDTIRSADEREKRVTLYGKGLAAGAVAAVDTPLGTVDA